MLYLLSPKKKRIVVTVAPKIHQIQFDTKLIHSDLKNEVFSLGTGGSLFTVT